MDAIVDPHSDDHGKDDCIDEVKPDPEEGHRSNHPDQPHDQRDECKKGGPPSSEVEKDKKEYDQKREGGQKKKILFYNPEDL